MKIGYARVSSVDQNLERQIEALEKEGIEKLYTDKITGSTIERPNFKLMLEELKEGDIIIVKDLTRFTRSTRDLFELMDLIKNKGASLRSLNDKWLDTTEENPFNDLLLTILSALSEYERKLIKQRQKEGIDIAKKKGIYKGKPKTFTENNPRMKHALELYQSGEYTVKEVCRNTGISESTFYRNWRKLKNE